MISDAKGGKKWSQMDSVEKSYHLRKTLERFQEYKEHKNEAETKVIQTLFVLNTGVFAAVVGRSALATLSHDLLVSLVCSAAGVFALLLRAAWVYYRADYKLTAGYKSDLEAFYNDELGILTLLENDRVRSGRSHAAHGLAILSGVLWLVAAAYGLKGIVGR